jgi:anthranilate/para-aminobenzoate synthase component II
MQITKINYITMLQRLALAPDRIIIDPGPGNGILVNQ